MAKTNKYSFDAKDYESLYQKAYNGSSIELSSLLRITKEEAENMTSDFSFQLEEITRYEPAKIDQKLFDQILGDGVVKSREEFAEHIRKTMEASFSADSDFKFTQDLRAYLINRIGEVEFPEAMLKRIMKLNGKGEDDEAIEKNFGASLKELLWHLIKEQLSDQMEIKVEQPDVLETAKAAARMQFEQYGMMNVPDDALTNYANEMLKNKDQAEGLVSRTVENKIGQKAKETVKLKTKDVTLAEFNELLKPANK